MRLSDRSKLSFKQGSQIELAADGKTIAMVDARGAVHLGDLSTHSFTTVLQKGSPSDGNGLFSNDDRVLVLNLGRRLFDKHNFDTWPFGFRPSLANPVMQIWLTESGKMLGKIPDEGEAIALSLDGRTVVSQSGDSVKIWDIWDLVTDPAKMR